MLRGPRVLPLLATGALGIQPAAAEPIGELRPDDWAYRALAAQIRRGRCSAALPANPLDSQRSLSRAEAAVLLQRCLRGLDALSELQRRLQQEFAADLALVQSQQADLEVRLDALESSAFAPSTRLSGLATVVLGSNGFQGTHAPLVQQARQEEGSLSLNFDLRLSLNTSFSGKDLLRAELRAGNFRDSAFGNGEGLNQLAVAFQEGCGTAADCGDVVSIYRLFYQVPLGETLRLTVGGRVRQDDMLALWPSVYPADSILDFFTYAGAPGAYNTNRGTGAGLGWRNNGWSVSGSYIAANGDVSIGTAESLETGSLQLGYAAAGGGWGAAAIYTYTSGFDGGVYPGTATPLAALNAEAYPPLAAFGSDGVVQSLGLAAYWQPARSGWLPSISVGWGFNRINPGEGVHGFDRLSSQSWSLGLQWQDALIRGNVVGLAVGQPTFVTGCGNSCERLLGPGQASPRDGSFVWEGWTMLQVSDAISVTPGVFYLSNPYGQINSVLAQQGGQNRASFRNLGVVLKTTFRF
jgi:hypothetical protein